MEQRINEKINNYMTSFKTNIRKKVDDLNIDLSKNTQVCELILFIMDYENLVIEQDDVLPQRKKNTKKQPIIISDENRCCAKKVNDKQCSRKKKVGSEYCGSHIKATPYGCCDEKKDNSEQQTTLNQKIQISMEDIQGIIYYIDKNENVYHPQDIVNNVFNPRIISKYVKNSDNTFTLV